MGGKNVFARVMYTVIWFALKLHAPASTIIFHTPTFQTIIETDTRIHDLAGFVLGFNIPYVYLPTQHRLRVLRLVWGCVKRPFGSWQSRLPRVVYSAHR